MRFLADHSSTADKDSLLLKQVRRCNSSFGLVLVQFSSNSNLVTRRCLVHCCHAIFFLLRKVWLYELSRKDLGNLNLLRSLWLLNARSLDIILKRRSINQLWKRCFFPTVFFESLVHLGQELVSFDSQKTLIRSCVWTWWCRSWTKEPRSRRLEFTRQFFEIYILGHFPRSSSFLFRYLN